MGDEQTNPTVPQGTETNTPTETPQAPNQPTSLYDKTEAIVTRQEEANKKTEELLGRQETLHANQRLAGTSGGQVIPKETEQISDKEYADKFIKGEANPLAEDGISLN